ncbi:MAG: hypothetical protein HQL26_00135 [Candidatus Omnitrophica bacterium]|nr:hypothetical protein [Candidatus Omnitrophota bacterium]
MWDLFKFILFVLLIPFVGAAVVNFYDHLAVLPNGFQHELILGAYIFALVFIFLHKLEPIYEFGQNIVLKCFQFASPVNKAISCFFPFYTFLICIAFVVLNRFFKNENFNAIGFYIFGFTLLMHVVLTAQQVQNGEKPIWKPNYYFSMSCYLITLTLVCALFLDLILLKFQFPSFLTHLYLLTKKYYIWTVKKILLLK